MLDFIVEHIALTWRKWILSFLTLMLSSAIFFLVSVGYSYARESIAYSAQESTLSQSYRVYNDQVPAQQFLSEVRKLRSVEVSQVDFGIWAQVVSGEASVQVKLKPVVDESIRMERPTTGEYPSGPDDIMLTDSLAHSLDLSIGDIVTVLIPDTAESSGHNYELTGTFSYSPLNPRLDNTLTAVVGSDIEPLWLAQSGNFPLNETSMLITHDPSVSEEQLRSDLNSIPGTVVEDPEQQIASAQSQHSSFIIDMLRPLDAAFALVVLTHVITLIVASNSVAKESRAHLTLLRRVGASQLRIFTLLLTEFMIVACAATIAGIALGHAVAISVHRIVISAPGGSYLPGILEVTLRDVCTVAALSILVSLIAVLPVALIRTYRLHHVQHLLPRQTRFLITAGYIALGVGMLILTASLSQRNAYLREIFGSDFLWPSLTAMALTGVLALAFCEVFGAYLSRSRRNLKCLLSLSWIVSHQRGDRSHYVTTSMARLTMLASAMITTALVVTSSSDSGVEELANNVAPYDLSVEAPDSFSNALSEDAYDDAISAEYVDNALAIYSASFPVGVMDSAASLSSLLIYGIDADKAQQYFTGTEVTQHLDNGAIVFPHELMTYLQIDDGDTVILRGPRQQRLLLDAYGSSSSWVFTTTDALSSLTAIQGPSALWLTLSPGASANESKAFVDYRMYMDSMPSLASYHLSPGLTKETLNSVMVSDWTTPITFAFLTLGLIFALVSSVNAINSATGQRRTSYALVRSLGVSERMIRKAFLTEIFVRISVSVSTGILVGISTSYFTLKSGLFGARQTTVSFPYQTIALVFVISIVVAIVSAYTLSTFSRDRKEKQQFPADEFRIR